MMLLKRKLQLNEFVTTSLLYVLSSFLIKGVSFITTPIFTRLMGTTDFGIVSNFVIWEQVFATFICLQVSSGILVAKVNYASERLEEYMKSITLFATFSAFAQSMIVLFFATPISRLLKLNVDVMYLLCIGAFGVSMTNICSGYFIANNSPLKKIAFSVSACIMTVVFGLGLVFYSEDKALGRIQGFTISNFCIIVFGLYYFLKNNMPNKENFLLDIKYALAFGMPLIPHLLANLINGSADRVFILHFCGESEVGIYSLAYSIGHVVLFFVAACTDAWLPWYFKKTKLNNDIVNKEISNCFCLYTLAISLCLIGIMLFAPEIMSFMAPEEYWSGITCVLYIALGVFFLFLYRFPVGYEQLSNNTKFIAPTTIFTSVINLMLNYFLIPVFGINGAAIATAVSFVILWISHEFVSRKIICGYNINISDYILAIVFVVSAFISSLAFVNSGVYVRILIFLGYVSFCLIKLRKVKIEKYL